MTSFNKRVLERPPRTIKRRNFKRQDFPTLPDISLRLLAL